MSVSQEQELAMIIRYGMLSAIKSFLDKNSLDLNAPCFKGLPPLHLAASMGHNNVVEFLLRNYPAIDLFGRDVNGHMAVYCADSANKLDVAYNLIKRHEAKWKSPDTSTKFLLREEAYVITQMFGHFLGYIADKWWIKDAKKLFITKRAIYAAFSIEIKKYLNKSLSKPEKDRLDSLESCAQHISDFQDIDSDDMKWIETMCGNTKAEITTAFAKLSGAEKANFGLLMQKYISRGFEESKKIFNDNFPYMFTALDEPDTRDNQVNKSLIQAVVDGHMDMVKYLANLLGADINIKDDDGWTLLIKATCSGNLDMVKFLVDKGADVNAMSKDGKTPLMGAVFHGHLNVVKYLVDKSADVNAKDKIGMPPLMFAAGKSHLDIVRFLVANGADVNAKDENGWTPLRLAARDKYQDVIGFLKQHGAKE